jgi:hypothetical protein
VRQVAAVILAAGEAKRFRRLERIRRERVDRRRIVDLGVMGESEQRGASIDADLGKRLVWPRA